MGDVIRGACLCGGVAFDVREPDAMEFCHCTRCQRWSGGPGMPSVAVEAANFKVTEGQDLMKHFTEEGFSRVCFCGRCGSSLYAEGGEKYFVSAGCLQNLELELTFHMMVAYKASWDEICGTAPQYPERPPEA